MDRLHRSLQDRRWAHVSVAVLRILLGFALLPAGIKKLLGEPFTEASNVGTFHEFLHAFHATGAFYQFVGVVQILAACLLMTQRFATLGAAVAFPVLVAIFVFCWSTQVYFTAVVVTLMLGGMFGLIFWDWPRWRRLWRPEASLPAASPLIDTRLWGRCGIAIFVFYVSVVAISGGVYRPRGVEWDNPSFYVLPALTLFPLVTYLIERRARRVGRR